MHVTFPLFVAVDEIYNLACPASPIHYQYDPVQTTKTSVHGAINMLGLAKRLNTKIFQTSTREVYGDPNVHSQVELYYPNMHPDDGRVVSDFILQALRNESITIYGDGSQTRSFCYVDDLIEAFVLLLDSSDEITGPVNLGNPFEFSIKQLAEKVIELTGTNSKLEYKPTE